MENMQVIVTSLKDLILRKEYSPAVSLFQDLELELEEWLALVRQYPSEMFQNHQFDFHSLYLLCLLRVENYNEAKYLWKRTHQHFKDSSQGQGGNSQPTNFSLFWELGKLFFQNEVAQALKLTQQYLSNQTVSSNDLFTTILLDIYEYNSQKLLHSLSLAYRPLLLATVSKYFGLPDSDTQSILSKHGYQYNDQQEVSLADGSVQVQNESRLIKDFLEKTVSIERIAQYAHHLQREPLKVDVNAGPEKTIANLATPSKGKSQK